MYTVGKLLSDSFDMISTDFDNDKAIIEHRTNTANNNIDYLEEKGYLGSKANYSAIASATQDEINKSTAKIETLKAERAYALSNPYSGIVKDSEQDKEFQKAIQEEIENRQELNTQLAEANNNMRQVDWDRFDYIQERISDISSEADFMIDLMAQRKDELYQDRGHTDKVENANVAGKFTDKGVAVMGLHGQNYKRNSISRCRCLIISCRMVSRSFSAKHHTRSTGLSRIKVICFRYMQENSEY